MQSESKKNLSEGADDIFTGADLYEACSPDINRICNDIPIEAAQISS
jgi:hypothetical protein